MLSAYLISHLSFVPTVYSVSYSLFIFVLMYMAQAISLY